MPNYPTIDSNPELGITESAVPSRTVLDIRAGGRSLPMLTPEENAPLDDAHRINHAIKMVAADLDNVELASILGLPAYILLDERR